MDFLRADQFLGGYAEGVTPVPIPNTEVKPLWADDTAWVAMWESRSPPGILLTNAPSLIQSGEALVFGTSSGLFSLLLSPPFVIE